MLGFTQILSLSVSRGEFRTYPAAFRIEAAGEFLAQADALHVEHTGILHLELLAQSFQPNFLAAQFDLVAAKISQRSTLALKFLLKSFALGSKFRADLAVRLLPDALQLQGKRIRDTVPIRDHVFQDFDLFGVDAPQLDLGGMGNFLGEFTPELIA